MQQLLGRFAAGGDKVAQLLSGLASGAGDKAAQLFARMAEGGDRSAELLAGLVGGVDARGEQIHSVRRLHGPALSIGRVAQIESSARALPLDSILQPQSASRPALPRLAPGCFPAFSS